MAEQLHVMCLTWNLETDKPDPGQLKPFLAEQLAKHGKPDVIAIGIQEGDGNTDYGNLFAKALDGYICVTQASFKGVTKPAQLLPWKSLASQGVYTLVNTTTLDFNRIDKVRSEKKPKSWAGEKGHVFSEITFNGKRLGFVSMHAEVKEEKRGADFASIIKGLSEYTDKDDKFHAIFYMGDLNYRLNRKCDEKKMAKEMEEEKEAMWAAMTTMAGREKLLAGDSFQPPDTGGAFKMRWPDFNPQCLPTYKRERGKEAQKALAALGKDPNKYDESAIRILYELKPSKKGLMLWECGWLDRIGHADGESGSLMAKGLKFSKTKGPGLLGGNHLSGGDHVPVFVNIVFDVIPTK